MESINRNNMQTEHSLKKLENVPEIPPKILN